MFDVQSTFHMLTRTEYKVPFRYVRQHHAQKFDRPYIEAEMQLTFKLVRFLVEVMGLGSDAVKGMRSAKPPIVRQNGR